MGAKTVHWLAARPGHRRSAPLSTPARHRSDVRRAERAAARARPSTSATSGLTTRGGSLARDAAAARRSKPRWRGSFPRPTTPSTHSSSAVTEPPGSRGSTCWRAPTAARGRRTTDLDDPLGYGDPVAVLPGGRLVLDIEGWSDARNHHPSAHPVGSLCRHRLGVSWQAVPLAGPFAHQDSHTLRPDDPGRGGDDAVGDDLRQEARREGRGVVDRRRRDLERRTSALIADPAGPFLRLPACRPVCPISSSRSGVSWSPAGCRRWSRSPSSTSWPTAST